ncbi:MAG TPA: nuclear transport factor 2 family protein [Alcanivorax sp.]|nr:nuclear transport factor 2 family protein [Alcanivorax sp.]
MKSNPLALIALLLFAVSGCASRAEGPNGYTHLYEQAVREQPGSPRVSEQALARFVALYSPMNADYIEAHIDEVYARDLYFNDTLTTVYQRDKLKAHMLETAERLDYMSLEIQNRWQQGEDVFLQWIMETRFTILGSKRDVRTIGISQLRFNDQGKVVFHQDFWDSSQGLDQQLPIVGGFSRWLRDHP